MTVTSTISCGAAQGQLLDLHFSTLEAAERDALEAHLGGCAACVTQFLALKRSCDEGEGAPAPSSAVAARVHRSAAAAFRPPPSRWERPVALALAAMLTLFAMSAVGQLSHLPSHSVGR
jgi:anti-sigma factor RsiW